MRIFRYFGIVALASMVLPACRQEEEIPQSVDVLDAAEEYVFTAKPRQNQMFSIDSYRSAWKVTKENLDWLSINPVNGCGGKETVTMSAENNSTCYSREGVVTLTCDFFTKTIKVTQMGQDPVVELSAESFEASYAGDEMEFTLTSNGNWTVSGDCDSWVSLSEVSGELGNSNIVVTVAANLDENPRQGTLVFTVESVTEQLKIIQEGKPQGFVNLTVNEITLTGDGTGFENISFETGTEWTCECDSWLHVSPPAGPSGSNSVTVTADAADDNERTGTIKIISGDAYAYIDVFQEANIPQLPDNEVIDLSVVRDGVVLFRTTGSNKDNIPSIAAAGESAAYSSSGLLHAYDPDHQDMANLAWMQWEIAPENMASSLSPTYTTNTLKNSGGSPDIMLGGLKQYGALNVKPQGSHVNDGYVFHIPVKDLKEGQKMVFGMPYRGTTSSALYWNIQFSFDGSKWLDADVDIRYPVSTTDFELVAAKRYETSIGTTCNVKMYAAQKMQSFRATLAVDKDYHNVMVYVRFCVADDKIQVNGSAVSDVGTKGSDFIGKYYEENKSFLYDGPAFWVE